MLLSSSVFLGAHSLDLIVFSASNNLQLLDLLLKLVALVLEESELVLLGLLRLLSILLCELFFSRIDIVLLD